MTWEDTPFDFGDAYDIDRAIHQDHAEPADYDQDPAELTYQEDDMPTTPTTSRRRSATDWQGDLADLGQEIRNAAEAETREGLSGEFKRMASPAALADDDLKVIRHYLAQAAIVMGIDPRYFTGGVPVSQWRPSHDTLLGLALAGVLAGTDEFEW